MDKRYKSKNIKNLHDLHMEQVRVRNAYRNMELNWIQTILSPEVLLTTAVQSFLTPSSTKKTIKSGKRPWLRLFKKKNKQQPSPNHPVLDNVPEALTGKKQTTKKSYKKLGRNLLIWQAASLVTFIGVSLFAYFQKKKKERQAISE